MAQELAKLPNKVTIEGHTDAKPYTANRDYGNWELSADRANTARRLMQLNGVRPNQVSQVRGYADQKLRTPNNPLDSSNRRITLIVQYITKDEDAAPAATPAKDSSTNAGGEPAGASLRTGSTEFDGLVLSANRLNESLNLFLFLRR